MASESSVLATYNSNVQNVLSTLTNRDIDINDRFDLVARAFQAGVQVVEEEHNQRIRLADKVSVLEDENIELIEKLQETEDEVTRLNGVQKQNLDRKVAKKIKSLNRKEKLLAISENTCTGGAAIAGVSCILGGVLFPPSLAGTIPATIGILTGGVVSTIEKEKAFKEKWILEHYPEALNDDTIRKQAEQEYLKIGKKEFYAKYPTPEDSEGYVI